MYEYTIAICFYKLHINENFNQNNFCCRLKCKLKCTFVNKQYGDNLQKSN